MDEYGQAVDSIGRYTGLNRDSWNAIAPSRATKQPEFFRQGGSTLDDFEIDLLPDLDGKQMLHMACANGVDSVSWAMRGASVTGVDLSEVAVESANALAEELAVDAQFIAADLYELPAGLPRFDVVYASWGVVCWLPDLDRWADIVVERLHPGGTFLLCEHHPLWEVLGVRPGGVAVTVDYFGRSRPTVQTYDQSKRPTGSTPATQFNAFVWPVSDVVTSLLRAGLHIEKFYEAPMPEMYEGLGPASVWLPGIYVIKAKAPSYETVSPLPYPVS